ncbi:MAG: PIN/TRAM domain-containing protein [Anaerovibrio sp.]|uniref:PIN/TRAM domain-containing protein n=1 Tax=Anaerovibrio sp. TaxID=1872532 RepID=UPI0025FB85DA|nr:PIN/TRAM domain-containing protein [Anaerovibrio sp.]MCR5176721.1 PIN/TRAM domain-containing protein [Anaerovibrio sp.]
MLDKVLRFLVTALLAVIGGLAMHFLSPFLTELLSTEVLNMNFGLFKITLANMIFILIGILIGAVVGYSISPFFASKLRRFSVWVETQLNKMPLHDVISGVIGLAIGLIIANLLGVAFSKIPVVGDYIPVILSVVFGYLGIHIVIRKQKELQELIGKLPRFFKEASQLREQSKKKKNKELAGYIADNTANEGPCSKLLDTSVIIDGRIADICSTGFIDGKLLIPVFVLEELQHIADMSDSLKRVRGRRGLDILKKLQNDFGSQVEIVNQDFDDISEVDSKLVRLGQLTGSKIITNDYNLNKVAELRGVPVLNINELANAIKPVVIPGEYMHVTVVKEGKEQGQGVAYLEDGTMIVVENGRKFINEAIKVEVTSALQTAAGRMIFAKPVS